MTLVHSTFTVDRTFSAPIARVFNAFENPEIRRRWFVEGEGWEIVRYELNFKAGSREGGVFRFQGGPEIGNDTLYTDIIPNERIVFAYTMTVAGKNISSSLVTVQFSTEGDTTRLTYTEQGAYFEGGQDAVRGREAGTKELFEKLALELTR
ncbi:putative glutathione S-transferase-related transmembrane protein [Myxococcus hansupus]|uniref:Putative glutathione S-transferase-related transmembrane protein n=1 Tax=Pseudomyxococcus hansupus TaxID=1297742 RepID=A0A0H4XD99_9BACT|nr:SRPBCC family protein [Myxococcus hansupus]AKQ65987.1 putative glutathione S-transferase-related transmembrane protein [Myxococcus hansupus]